MYMLVCPTLLRGYAIVGGYYDVEPFRRMFDTKCAAVLGVADGTTFCG